MDRTRATKFLRETLDNNNLRDWKVRLTTDLTRTFLGLCSYKDKTIILNAHHIDTAPEPAVIDVIYHEVAHALTPYDGHGSKWALTARSLGCTNTLPCPGYAFNETAIDAIRSGALLQVDYEVETHTVYKPKYTIQRLQEKCPICKKPSHEVKRIESHGNYIITLECFHVIIKPCESRSNFETLTFDGSKTCNHIWNKTICKLCNAKKLYPYQIEGAKFLEKQNGRAAILDEMGLGKTIQALAYLYFNQSSALPFIWTTKSGIKYQHASEIVRIFGDDFVPFVVKSSKDVLVPGFKCYVFSYDIFRRLTTEQIKNLNCKTIVLDEVQAIKNPDSSRTKAIREVMRDLPHIIPLSGTPWKNRGSEFFVMLNALDPSLFHSYKDFTNRYCDVIYQGNKQTIGGIADPVEFKKKIAHIAIRRERKEVMPDLPSISRMELKTELEGINRKIYDEELNKLIKLMNQAKLEGLEDDAKTKLAARQFIMVMRQIVGLAKVPASIDFIEEFLEETDRKLIVGYHHLEVASLFKESLKTFCKENKLPEPLIVNGGMSAEERFEIQNKFNSSDYRLLLASTLASGEGLNLQTCSDMLIVERQWNAANEEQLEGRMIRIGQKSTVVNATYVHAKDTIDIDLNTIVEDKRRAFDGSMNKDGYQNTWNDSDVVSQLIENIMRRKGK